MVGFVRCATIRPQSLRSDFYRDIEAQASLGRLKSLEMQRCSTTPSCSVLSVCALPSQVTCYPRPGSLSELEREGCRNVAALGAVPLLRLAVLGRDRRCLRPGVSGSGGSDAIGGCPSVFNTHRHSLLMVGIPGSHVLVIDQSAGNHELINMPRWTTWMELVSHVKVPRCHAVLGSSEDDQRRLSVHAVKHELRLARVSERSVTSELNTTSTRTIIVG